MQRRLHLFNELVSVRQSYFAKAIEANPRMMFVLLHDIQIWLIQEIRPCSLYWPHPRLLGLKVVCFLGQETLTSIAITGPKPCVLHPSYFQPTIKKAYSSLSLLGCRPSFEYGFTLERSLGIKDHFFLNGAYLCIYPP